jgi:hypothetical protein
MKRRKPIRLRSILILGCALFVGQLPTLVGAAELYEPGKIYFGRSNYVEYLAGDLPVILSAPHGGRERPDEIPDRKEGTFAFDTNTQELARAVRQEFFERTGHYPHVILCRLQRKKVDCNREIKEAAAGNPHAEQAWREFQGYIESARKAVVAKSGRGFYIDLHGHGHKEQRLELGYLHSRDTLKKSDEELNRPGVAAEGGLWLAAQKSKLPYAELLRGERSLGALMEQAGFPCSPSPTMPHPPEPYFRGGYNVVQHAHDDDPIAGLQIETYFKGVRDNDKSRQMFAGALFVTVKAFLAERLELKLPEKANSPVRPAPGEIAPKR